MRVTHSSKEDAENGDVEKKNMQKTIEVWTMKSLLLLIQESVHEVTLSQDIFKYILSG